MAARFNALLARIDGLNARERAIIFAAGAILIILAWYGFLGEEAFQQRTKLQSDLDATATELADVKARVAQQGQLRANQADPAAKLADLELRTTAVEEQIQDYAAELISPTEMARVLERVLERRSALRLLRLRNFGAEDLLPENSPGQNRLYRHGLEIELEGPYLAVLAYLEDLEALPWRLYWQVLEIEADEYPKNRVRIEVATLSLDEDWIGV